MVLFEIWMCIIGISMALSGLPQIYRIYKNKSSNDVSLSLWILVTHGIFWWLIYGIIINSISIIITNFICLIIDLIILFLVIKYRRI
jgi:MtN3 and saliva related transmembrane protein